MKYGFKMFRPYGGKPCRVCRVIRVPEAAVPYDVKTKAGYREALYVLDSAAETDRVHTACLFASRLQQAYGLDFEIPARALAKKLKEAGLHPPITTGYNGPGRLLRRLRRREPISNALSVADSILWGMDVYPVVMKRTEALPDYMFDRLFGDVTRIFRTTNAPRER